MICTDEFMKKHKLRKIFTVAHIDPNGKRSFYNVVDSMGRQKLPDGEGNFGKTIELSHGSGEFVLLPIEYHPKRDEIYEDQVDCKRSARYICGPSGSGKSYESMKYIREYHLMYPDNSVVLITPVPSKEALKTNFITVFDLSNPDVAEYNFIDDFTKIKIETVMNSLVIFDDTENLKDKALKESIQELLDEIMTIGRHHGVSIVVIRHLPANGKCTQNTLKEVQFITVFPSCSAGKKNKYFFETYCGLSREDVAYMMKKKSRAVTLHTHAPNAMIGSNFLKIISHKY